MNYKLTIQSFLISILFVVMASCENDVEKPLVITTSDISFELPNDAVVGDTLGIVPGTSNRGSVGFVLVSQSVNDVFSVSTTTGDLILKNLTNVDAEINPEIVLEVSINKEGESEISNVTVIIESQNPDPGPSGCNDPNALVNTDIWNGDLDLQDIFGDTAEGVGVSGCDNLTINADLLIIGCEKIPEVLFTFEPTAPGETSGTVTAEMQDYDCIEGFDIQFEGTGTYDETTGIIEIEYSWTDGSGDPPIEGFVTVEPN